MRFAFAMIVVGGVLVFLGVQELRLSSAAKAEPQSISCADLAKNGPGENAHIVLTNFLLWDQEFVYEAKSDSSSGWSTVWAPIVPEGGEFHQELLKVIGPDGKVNGPLPRPKSIDVIFKSKSVRNQSDLDAVGEALTLQGMVVNKIDSLGSEEKKILASSYPGIDFDKCWIIEHNRTPAGAGKLAGLIGGGAALIVLPGGFMLLRRKSA